MKILWVSPKELREPRLWRSLITKAENQINGKVYRHHFCVDRTGTIETGILPFRFDLSNYVMPTLKESDITLEQCVFNRCNDIFGRTTQKIIFMYSGGKDSTCALVGFLKRFGLKECQERIIICANQDSITSNFEFYRDYIQGKFEILSSNNSNITLSQDEYKDNVIVNGDPANVFDGGLLLAHMIRLGINIGDKNWKDIIKKHHSILFFDYPELNCYSYLIDTMEISAASRGFKIENVFDFVWWYKHNFHWIVECLNMIKNFSPMLDKFAYGKQYWRNKFIPFFDTDEFVLWSFNNRVSDLKRKIKDNSLASYKLPLKQFMSDMITDQKFLTETDNVYFSNNLDKTVKPFFLLDENYKTYYKN